MSRTTIRRLALRNYRRFPRLEVDFDSHLTVLVAPNGGGKTAVLDAVALALRGFVANMMGKKAPAKQFRPGDVRLARSPWGQMVPQEPASMVLDLEIGDPEPWPPAPSDQAFVLTPFETPPPKPPASPAQAARKLLSTLQDYADGRRPRPPALPVIAYYGTARLWGSKPKGSRAKKTPLNQQVYAYADCLESSSTYDDFARWYEAVARDAQNAEKEIDGIYTSAHDGNRALDENENRRIRKAQQRVSYLEAVRKAADHVLAPSRWHTLDWGFAAEDIVAEHPELGELPISLLSDGVRNMLALVADLAHRCVRLNPHFGADAAKLTPGIVLIDEVDMHLHPEWQQSIVGALRTAFPEVQLIVTTHSPQVISTVNRESIRIIEADGTVRMPLQQTRGVESNALLAEVMGVDPIPPVEEARKVSEYRALIETERADSEAALRLRAEIIAHFGVQHPVVIDCDRLLRWQKFKARRPAPSEGV
jgi:predicted ATP-binding protein involved in virulence